MEHEIANQIEKGLTDIFGENRVTRKPGNETEVLRVSAFVGELTGEQLRKLSALSCTPGTEFSAKRSGTGIRLIFN